MLPLKDHSHHSFIERLINYQNPALMKLLQNRYLDPKGLSHLNADSLFLEFKKFIYTLFLVQTKQCNLQTFTVIKQLEILDEIWHQFILMTSDYQHFCFEIFGCYIHHEPEDNTGHPDTRSAISHSNSSLIEQIELVKQIWGQETVQTWYVDLPRQAGNSKVKKWLSFLRRN